MKNIKFIALFLAIFTSLTFTSCDNEPVDPAIDLGNGGGGNGGGGNGGSVVFKADFNGETWNANSSQAVLGGNFMQIGGIKTDGSSFGFLVEAASTGTYPANTNLLAYNPAGSEYGYWGTNFNDPTENTGSITITNIDTVNKKISGTFTFKGYWSNEDEAGVLPINFTNGVFTNVPYIESGETGDSFSAKVNGTTFNDSDILTIETTIGTQDFISIGAQDDNNNSITVSVRSSLGTGTYPITGNIATDSAQAVYSSNGVDNQASAGVVTITEKTATRIKGTFNFITNGTLPTVITEGTFDVEY